MSNKPENAARKGDVVAIEVTHSSTDAKFKRTEYKLFHLATVTRSNRAGAVREVQMAGSFHSVQVARVGRVYTLNGTAEAQGAARKLLATIESPTQNEWPDGEALRAAIRAHFMEATP